MLIVGKETISKQTAGNYPPKSLALMQKTQKNSPEEIGWRSEGSEQHTRADSNTAGVGKHHYPAKTEGKRFFYNLFGWNPKSQG